jgi:hypothetical protein
VDVLRSAWARAIIAVGRIMVTVDEALSELISVSPRDFVKARNALAARLKQEGDPATAKAVAAAKRPPITVWVVNRLAHEAGEAVSALTEASDRVKSAQLGRGGSAGGLSAATAQQRGLLAELMHRAEAVLRDADVRSSAELLRRIETTLMAAASEKEQRALLRKGRLEHELEALGFDAFAGTALPPRTDRHARPAPHHPSTSAVDGEGDHPSAAGPAVAAHGARESEQGRAGATRKRQREEEAARRAAWRSEALANVEKRRAELTAAVDKVRAAKDQLRQATEAVREAVRTEQAARRALDDATRQSQARG